MPAVVAGAVGLCLVFLAGCGGGLGALRSDTSGNEERDKAVAALAETLRDEALKLPDGGEKERLVSGLIQLRELMGQESMMKPVAEAPGAPKLPSPEGGAKPAPPWATIFAPTSLVIGFFTRTRDFDGQKGDDGLEVRIQPLDQFGDPTKAVGSYRIEVFEYRLRTTEKRGERLGHWFVSVLDLESARKFYDPVDRTYVFPLQWEGAGATGLTVIVQVTYYPPGGFQEKLFAQRVIKVGSE